MPSQAQLLSAHPAAAENLASYHWDGTWHQTLGWTTETAAAAESETAAAEYQALLGPST